MLSLLMCGHNFVCHVVRIKKILRWTWKASPDQWGLAKKNEIGGRHRAQPQVRGSKSKGVQWLWRMQPKSPWAGPTHPVPVTMVRECVGSFLEMYGAPVPFPSRLPCLYSWLPWEDQVTCIFQEESKKNWCVHQERCSWLQSWKAAVCP